METKWTADLATLLRFEKTHGVNVSSRGSNDSSVAIYKRALAAHFLQHGVSWKRALFSAFTNREDKSPYFPYPITFPLTFVPYDEKEVVPIADLPLSKCASAPFLHLFFITAATVEEYRTTVRHHAAEWFASLIAANAQWLIVVDVTRAKEKKTRSQLMERIRSDFSKHSSRVLEVSESPEHGSFSAFSDAVKTALLAHLDPLLDHWERGLKQQRDWQQHGWRVRDCVQANCDHARLFWSLGAVEHTMKLLDELDCFLFKVIPAAAVEATSPPWLSDMRSRPPPNCPVLAEAMKTNKLTDDSLLGVRHFLVAQQMLCSLHLYQQRVRKGNAAPSIRVDFASIILQYACHASEVVTENAALIGLSPSRLLCWRVLWTGQALSLCGVLAEPASADRATDALCYLHTDRFKALLQLHDLVFSGDVLDEALATDLSKWLEEECDAPDVARCVLMESLCSRQVLLSQLRRTHDVASAQLTQSGRKRVAAAIGGHMATVLGASPAALPLELRLLDSLLEGKGVGGPECAQAERVLALLDKEKDAERIAAIRLLLAQRCGEAEERARQQIEWEKACREGKGVMRWPSLPHSPPCPFRVFIEKRSPDEPSVGVPNEFLPLHIRLHSELEAPVDNYKIRVVLRQMNAATVNRHPKLAFKTEWSEREQRADIACIHKGTWVTPIDAGKKKWRELVFDTASDAWAGLEEEETEGEAAAAAPATPVPAVEEGRSEVASRQSRAEGVLLMSRADVERERSSVVLNKGRNDITLSALCDRRGVFVLERVEICLFDGRMRFAVPADHVTCADKPLMRMVQTTPNKLAIEGDPDGLLAGVWQCVWLQLEAGCQLGESELRIRPHEEARDRMQFRDSSGEWVERVCVSVPQLDKAASHRLPIHLCLQLDRLSAANPALRRSKMCLEWLGQSWSVELGFVPLFHTSSTTSLLQEKVLLEVELSRSLAPEWTVQLECASLSCDGAAAESLNGTEPLGSLVPGGVTSLVWLLPRHSDVPLAHQLSIKYRVLPTAAPLPAQLPIGDRQYEYAETVECTVPQVSFELCAQLLSSQPGAQLCRAGAACALVVSLRGLATTTHQLCLVIDADLQFWTLNETMKVVQVKESGLAQCAFSVVPAAAGYLPYPSVSVYSVEGQGTGGLERVSSAEGGELANGARLVSFQRTAGKQIRVLGSVGGVERESGRERSGIREKLEKLLA